MTHPTAPTPKLSGEGEDQPTMHPPAQGRVGPKHTFSPSFLQGSPRAILIRYKNWRGEVAIRRVMPFAIEFKATIYHQEEQWLMQAYDYEKRQWRDFAMNDMTFLPYHYFCHLCEQTDHPQPSTVSGYAEHEIICPACLLVEEANEGFKR